MSIRATVSALAAATVAAALPAQAAELRADFLFQNTLTNSLPTGGGLSSFGVPAYETRTVAGVSRRVYTFPADSGLSYIANIQAIQNGFSFAILFELDETHGYRKIIDFNILNRDEGLYVNDNDLSFYDHDGDRGLSAWLLPNRWVNLVYTWSPASGDTPPMIRVYADGRLEHESPDPLSHGILVSPLNSFYFFRDDNATADEDSGGSIARLRYWYGALTPAEVAALDTVPGGGPLCTADVDGDALVNVNDLLAFLGAFRNADADFDGNAATNVNGLLAYLGAFRNGC